MRMPMAIIIGLIFTKSAVAENLELTSSFPNQGRIPVDFTCDGKNISPRLTWRHLPPNTQSLVLILYNPDAPYGVYYNWIIYNIPVTLTFLPEGANENLPDGVKMGKTSSGDVIYRGPCPPNPALHHYVFKLFALDIKLNLEQGAEVDEVFAKIKKHIIKETELIGVFDH